MSSGPELHARSVVIRWLLIGAGWLLVVAGVVGIFLPLLPTVPFLLLAAACFARSSSRFHSWLVEHAHLGPLVKDYLDGGGIPLRAKKIAIALLWLSMLSTIIFFANALWLKLLLIFTAVAVTVYLIRLPTLDREGE